jgi:hypothetical protein
MTEVKNDEVVVQYNLPNVQGPTYLSRRETIALSCLNGLLSSIPSLRDCRKYSWEDVVHQSIQLADELILQLEASNGEGK